MNDAVPAQPPLLAEPPDTEVALRRSEERLRLAQAASGVGIFDWNLGSGDLYWSDQCRTLFGADPDERVDYALYRSRLHPDDRARVEAAITGALAPAGGGEYRETYRICLPDGNLRWIESRGRVAFALVDATRQAIRFLGTNLDITDRQLAEERLAESEARFRTITDAMPQMVWSARPDGHHDFFNARWYEFTGVPGGSTDGEAWRDLFHPDDRAQIQARWSQSLASGDPYGIEYRLRHHSGEYRWVLGRALPVRDENGRTFRWLGTCTDIDEMKRAEQHRQLLTDELKHRVKNTLAIVQAIAYQTIRKPVGGGDGYAAFEGRLQALGAAHDMLTRSDWTRTSLAELVEDARRASGVDAERLIVCGDDFTLAPKQAVAIAMAFHELSTNALKYGAFSAAAGIVEVAWAASGHLLQTLHLTWTERGGPLVQPPRREGFGTRMLSRALAAELGGSVHVAFEPEGVICTITAPLLLQQAG